ncbi:ABC transporter substrate-binding protein [Paenibacillus abyssi]|uniref:ABC transporter substrate-binding protein n=1 Tax=Paenibacillus abyssi TaxID=1340531 RepID=A0A917FNS4_9BACL|nr:ABC transporter substrate-binding protein [Paenibacillus abyssi]GGF96237.1 ABC transporter substrate-binding protein [Paenibacillus abyssi]
MKKTLLLLSMIITLIIAGCGNGNNGASEGAGGDASGTKEVTLKVFNFKVEMAEQLDRLAKEYEAENPGIKVVTETCGGGCDYSAALKTKFSAGDKPDIFFVAGHSDLDLWEEHLEDLTDQPWVGDIHDFAKVPMTKDGKVYGMPLNLEGWGFIYNKDLFAQAGITELPKTISELEAAAKQLQDAGITPFINGYAEWWILGNHLMNIGFAQQDDPVAYIEAVKQGQETITGNQTLNEWANLFELTVQYGQPNSLQTDYNTQVTNFANGKAAMMQQGNWTQIQLLDINPDLQHGFLPMPINDDAEKMDKLPIGVPNNWVVHKNSAVKEQAKTFLNWMVTSEVGKRYIVEEFKFIPALKTISADESQLGPLAADIIAYSDAGKAIPWVWQRYPGYEANTSQMASTMQAFVGNQVSREQMFEQFQKTWEEFAAQ